MLFNTAFSPLALTAVYDMTDVYDQYLDLSSESKIIN